MKKTERERQLQLAKDQGEIWTHVFRDDDGELFEAVAVDEKACAPRAQGRAAGPGEIPAVLRSEGIDSWSTRSQSQSLITSTLPIAPCSLLLIDGSSRMVRHRRSQ